MKSSSGKFRFGSSYCPYAKSGDVDMSVWERDFSTMRELNFNALRCFVAWDRIEFEEGQFDFSKLDYVFELAGKHGIDVMLNIGGVFECHGGIYPPRWLIYDYKCQPVIDDPQRPPTPFGPYRRLCPDDETFSSKARNFTARTVRRYSGRKELFGWNVWNEAFSRSYCHCPKTLSKFRAWLKERYGGDLDKLNEIWGTEFPLRYRSWDAVEPGLGAGFLSNSYAARLDWLAFERERIANWVEGVSAIVRENDALRRPCSSNVVNTALCGDPTPNLPDLWSQSRSLDISGFSFYTFRKPWHLSAALSSLRMASRGKSREFWVLETEAGQVGSKSLYPDEVADGPRRESTHWLSVLHGAKTILLWKFGGRVTDNQTDIFNLTAWDGSVTERARLNAKVAKTLIDNEEIFLDKTYEAEAAILHSSDNAIFSHVSNSYKEWQDARMGASRLMRDLRIPADFINDAQVRGGLPLSKYKVLILPELASLDKPLAGKLAAFVKDGGRVVADQRFAIFDQNSRNLLQAPGHGLKELLGAHISDFLLGPEETEVSFMGGFLAKAGGSLRSVAHVDDESAVAAGRYPDGSVAAVEREAGKGRMLYFGFRAFRDYERRPDSGFAAFMRGFFERCGVSSDYLAEGLSDDCDLEFGALTEDDGAKVHFLINLGAKDVRFKLSIRSAAGKRLRDLLEGSSCDFSGGFAEISLPAWRTKILI